MNDFLSGCMTVLLLIGGVATLVGFAGFLDTRKVDRRFKNGYRDNAIDTRDVPRARKIFLLGIAVCLVAVGIGSLRSTSRAVEQETDMPTQVSASPVQATTRERVAAQAVPTAPAASDTGITQATPAAAQIDEQGTYASPTLQPAGTFATSFDCNRARSDSEILICRDPELAAADIDLAGVYARAKVAATDPATFKEGAQLAWNARERECHDRKCLVRWYAQQKLRLENIAKFGS